MAAAASQWAPRSPVPRSQMQQNQLAAGYNFSGGWPSVPFSPGTAPGTPHTPVQTALQRAARSTNQSLIAALAAELAATQQTQPTGNGAISISDSLPPPGFQESMWLPAWADAPVTMAPPEIPQDFLACPRKTSVSPLLYPLPPPAVPQALGRALKPGDDENTNISKRLSWFLRKGAQHSSGANSDCCIPFRAGGWVAVDDLARVDVLAHIPRARLLEAVDNTNREKVRYELHSTADVGGLERRTPMQGETLMIRALKQSPRERKAKAGDKFQQAPPGLVPPPPLSRPSSFAASKGSGSCTPGGATVADTPGIRRRMLGELLFPMIEKLVPALAGKVTGMLLELSDFELFPLLEHGSLLQERVQEALAVLSKGLTASPVPESTTPRIYNSI